MGDTHRNDPCPCKSGKKFKHCHGVITNAAPAKQPEIFATFWRRNLMSNQWFMDGMEGLTLIPSDQTPSNFFRLQNPETAAAPLHGGSVHDHLARVGTIEFLMKQRIVPVVAWVEGERSMRCIGTGFIISCSGYVATACHVLLDPQEYEYGKVRLAGNVLTYGENLNVGVLIPVSPAYGQLRANFFPFRQCRFWGRWKESPLIHEQSRFDSATDIAIAKIEEPPNGIAHQPLNLSLRPFQVGDRCMAVGYAEMKDIPFNMDAEKRITLDSFASDLYVSIGGVVEVLADNHITRSVPTPGPCFHFAAKIPGKMSGAPIFDAEGFVVRGVVSRSLSGVDHAYGCMLSPIMDLPVWDDATLRTMIAGNTEGIPKVQTLIRTQWLSTAGE